MVRSGQPHDPSGPCTDHKDSANRPFLYLAVPDALIANPGSLPARLMGGSCFVMKRFSLAPKCDAGRHAAAAPAIG